MRVFVLVWTVVALVACTPRSAKPGGDSHGKNSLFVPSPSAANSPEGPLRVVHHAPVGETDGQVELNIVFDRPVVALGTDTRADSLLEITPPLPGEAHFVGSQAVVFRPTSGWPKATEFHVRLRSGVRALDGQALAEPFEFSFTTPAPELVRVSPYDGARGEERTRAFELVLNQDVDLAQLTSRVSVSSRHRGVEAAVKFRVQQPDSADSRRFHVLPVAPWPRDAEIAIRVAPGLLGVSGPRPMVAAFTSRFFTYGPLTFASVAPCAVRPGGRCDPGDGISISFTNPVALKDVARALVFDPPLTNALDPEEYGDYRAEQLYVYGGLKPLTRYTARLDKPIRDVHGQALSAARTISFETGPYEPLAYLPSSGEIAEPRAKAEIPLVLRNLQRVAARVTRLSFEQLVTRLAGESESDAAGARPAFPARVQRLANAGPAEEKSIALDVGPSLSLGHGVVEVEIVAGSAKDRDVLARRLIAFTDLAPALKIGATGGAVWVTRLGSAAPVSSARVRVVGCERVELAAGSTDAEGVFRFDLKEVPTCEVVALVSHDDDLAFTRQYAGIGPYGLTEHAEPYAASDVDALLFTERGVYRPGESVQVKAIVRTLTARGLEVPRQPVAIVVADARDRTLYSESLALSEFGTAAVALTLPADVALGTLSVTAKLGDHSFSTSADVAEFKRVELTTTVTAGRATVVSGERADVRVHAEYLFGANVSGQPLTWAARRVESSVRPRGERFEGFSFEDVRRYFEDVQSADDTEVSGGEGRLDDAGDALLQVPLQAPGAGQPVRYEIEATVDGLGGASASGRTFVDVTPASFVVGLRTHTTLAAVGSKVDVEALAASLDGQVSSAVQLNVSLDRRVYTTRQGRDDAGARTQTTEKHDVMVDRCRIADARQCALTPKEAGLHFVRVEARDKLGRTSTASVALYVYGAGTTSFGEDDGTVLQLKADKSVYKPGEVARIVVPSPFVNAEALVTVERENVLSIEHRSVRDGSLVIDMPIDARFVPNAFVSVLLVRPRVSASDGDSGQPAYRIGVVEIATDTSTRKLDVALSTSAAVVRPRAELGVDVRVRDHGGRGVPAELTIFAVDEGVLALTGYRTPDPYTYFYRPRGLAVWTSDARSLLIDDSETADSLGEKGGSEGGGGGSSVRSDFRAVAFYAAGVPTDKEGRAHVAFTLPDSITKYRVMAVAVSRTDALGAGELAVRTQKRLMLTPSLPRVMRAGDALRAGVVVRNETESTQDAEIRAELSGVVVVGPKSQKVKLLPHAAQEVSFDVRADQAGEARLLFSAHFLSDKAGADDDALAVTRRVLSPTALETVSIVGSTDARSTEHLDALPTLREDVGGLKVRVATSSLSSVSEVAEALQRYPYACTEQLSSRLLGLSALFALQAQGFDAAGVTRTELEQLVALLVRRQRSDGGFVLWPDLESEGHSHFAAFLTAYAVRALAAAADAGISDSTATRASAEAFLASYLRDERDGHERAVHDATRVFVLEALAATGHVDGAYLATLAERSRQLSATDRVSLFFVAAEARAKHAAGADELASRLLAEASQGVRMTASAAHVETNRGDAHQTYMASDLRATATLLLGLLRFDPAHALVQPLARYLSEAKGRDGTWGNTHDNAWGLYAYATYVKERERSTPDFDARVRLGDKSVLEAHLKGRGQLREVSVPMAQLPRSGAPLAIEKRGTGLLHHALSFSFARKDIPKDTVERGFFIERSYERIAPVDLVRGVGGAPTTSATVGDYVRVTLRVAVSATRDFVVIEDPLPAGIEPVSTLFTTSSTAAERALGAWNDSYTYREIFDDRVAFAITTLPPGVYHYSYLARAVTAGRFVVPVAKAEEMYHPETFGRTSGLVFDIAAK